MPRSRPTAASTTNLASTRCFRHSPGRVPEGGYSSTLAGGFIVVASKAGAAHHPAWYHNLRAHPDAVSVELDGRRVAVRPRVVEEPERTEVWRRVNDNYNGYETYAERAGGRVIPLVVLEPI